MIVNKLTEAVARKICTVDEQDGGAPWEWYIATNHRKGIENYYNRANAAIEGVFEAINALKVTNGN